MDVASLRECICSTLSANADIRRAAELQLKAVSYIPQQSCLEHYPLGDDLEREKEGEGD